MHDDRYDDHDNRYDDEDGPDWPDTCAAAYVTGGHDPYATECELAPGHTGSHIGADPFDNGGRVEWSGGGWIDGDPLPYREVRWFAEDGTELHPTRPRRGRGSTTPWR